MDRRQRATAVARKMNVWVLGRLIHKIQICNSAAFLWLMPIARFAAEIQTSHNKKKSMCLTRVMPTLSPSSSAKLALDQRLVICCVCVVHLVGCQGANPICPGHPAARLHLLCPRCVSGKACVCRLSISLRRCVDLRPAKTFTRLIAIVAVSMQPRTWCS